MIVSRTPMRISLGGGGTDLPSYASQYEGFVISVAINKYSYVVLNPRELENTLRINHAEIEIAERIDDIRNGIVREALRLAEVQGGLEISTFADVPFGTGLGGSGSFGVGLLNALHALHRRPRSVADLAEEACRIEMEILKQPIGKHDQYINAFGGVQCLDIDREGRVTVTTPKIPRDVLHELQHNSLIFYTGISRSASDVLAEQSKSTAAGETAVVNSLHRIKEIGLQIRDELERGNLAQYGALMHEHWETKRNLSSKVSNGRIDRWYEIARENGALGGKIMGAGNGGFFMFYCESGKEQLREALRAEGLVEMHYAFDYEGTKIICNS